MTKFKEKISTEGFTIDEINIDEINELSNWLPKNGVFDLNIAEIGMVKSLHGQSICQEIIAKIDRLLSTKEGTKNKAFGEAYLNKSIDAGHKVVKSREVFSEADDDYIKAADEVAIAKAAKKWFENKASSFLAWHYLFKTFTLRDYKGEQTGNFQSSGQVSDDEDVNWTGSEGDEE